MADHGARDMQRMLQSTKTSDRRNFRNMVVRGYYTNPNYHMDSACHSVVWSRR